MVSRSEIFPVNPEDVQERILMWEGKIAESEARVEQELQVQAFARKKREEMVAILAIYNVIVVPDERWQRG